jgi:RNA polymerase sigma factor (sigma-70 family)
MWTDDPEAGADPDPVRVPDWPELVCRYDRLVRSICRRFALTEAESADVAQQCWLKLWEHRSTVRDARALAGWIRTTVRRDCMVVRTARWRETPEDLPVEVTLAGTEEPDPATTVVGADDRRRLRDAIRTLPQRERLLLEVLLDPAEPSYSEVARRTCMPVGSIGPVRARALRRLRVALGEQDEDARVVVSLAVR